MNTNHIVFFTQLYYPDMTTTAIIMSDLVEDLAAYGLDVEVVRAQPTYIKNSVPQITQINADLKKIKGQKTYKIIDPQIKQIKIGGSVDLGRSPRVECHNGVSIRRVWSFLFAYPALLPFLGFMGAKLRGQKYAILVHDLWPELPAHVEMIRKGGITEPW